MNHSGEAIAAFARYYRLDSSQILVAHDELDFAPGRVKLKQGGGAAGHNGLRDTTKHLGSPDYLRLRLGMEIILTNEVVHPHVAWTRLARRAAG